MVADWGQKEVLLFGACCRRISRAVTRPPPLPSASGAKCTRNGDQTSPTIGPNRPPKEVLLFGPIFDQIVNPRRPRPLTAMGRAGRRQATTRGAVSTPKRSTSFQSKLKASNVYLIIFKRREKDFRPQKKYFKWRSTSRPFLIFCHHFGLCFGAPWDHNRWPTVPRRVENGKCQKSTKWSPKPHPTWAGPGSQWRRVCRAVGIGAAGIGRYWSEACHT